MSIIQFINRSAPLPLPPGGNDAFTSLLLHCEGVDGSPLFPDASSYGHAVTAHGDAQVDTAQFKFGTGSCLLAAAGAYLTVASHAAFGFGTGDFTLDFQIWFDDLTSQQNIITFAGDAGAVPAIYKPAGASALRFYNGGDKITGSTPMSTGSFGHVELARADGSTRLFYNGVQQGATFADTTNYGTFGLVIGAHVDGSLRVYGRFDETRVSKGIARHTSGFTPRGIPYF